MREIITKPMNYSVSYRCLYGEHKICVGKFDVGDVGTEKCDCPCHSNRGIVRKPYWKQIRENISRVPKFYKITIILVIGMIIGAIFGGK